MKLIKMLAMLVVLTIVCQFNTGCFSITSSDGHRTTRFSTLMDMNVTIIEDNRPWYHHRYYGERILVPYSSERYYISETKRMYGIGGGNKHYHQSPSPQPVQPTPSYWEMPSPWGGRPSAGPGQPYR